MKTRSILAAAALAVGPLALSAAPSHAAQAYQCQGAVLFNVNIDSGWWSIAPLAYACDTGIRQIYAYGDIVGRSFNGLYNDGVCRGNVSGVVVGEGDTATLDGTLSGVVCGGTGGFAGTFSASGTWPAGVMAATIF